MWRSGQCEQALVKPFRKQRTLRNLLRDVGLFSRKKTAAFLRVAKKVNNGDQNESIFFIIIVIIFKTFPQSAEPYTKFTLLEIASQSAVLDN